MSVTFLFIHLPSNAVVGPYYALAEGGWIPHPAWNADRILLGPNASNYPTNSICVEKKSSIVRLG